MNVAIGNDGGLTQSCKSQITAISTNLVNTGVDGADKFGDILENIALSVKSGNITFEVENVSANSAEFSITCSTPDLLPEEEDEWAISVALIFKMSFNSDSGKEFEVAKFAEAALPVVAAVAGVVIVAALLPEGAIVAIIEALTVSSSALAGFVGA